MEPLVAGPPVAGRFAVHRGVLHVDGAPRFLWSADYPYYRDDPANWADRLAKLRAAGIEVVTCYVPWRHHAPNDPFRGGFVDFDGSTQPNRDIKGFLRLVQEAGLLAMLKPGPFVHAELRYGGLPSYVDPDLNPRIEPEMTGAGALFRWIVSRDHPEANHSLPAPLDPVFVGYVEGWLQAVTRELVVPNTWPRGPIVALQLLNEGIYCDASNGILSNYGYSRSSTGLYRAFLEGKYGSLEMYNKAHGARYTSWALVGNPTHAAEEPVARKALLETMDRAQFAHVLYEEVALKYRHMMLAAGCDPTLPMYMNYNPNGDVYAKFPGSNDGWYTKVEWHPREGVQWGYTNWIGVVAHSAKAYVQYILAATRERGPNLEEDWGFSLQYDLAYAHTSPSFFQTLLYIACGATGINVYTGVGTTAWRDDANITLESIPWERDALARSGGEPLEYPGHAPISSRGELLHKYWTIAQLGDYLAAEGAGMATSRRAASLAWAVYTPYAWNGAWAPRGARDHKPWLRGGFRACPTVTYHGLEALIEGALATGLDHRQLDLVESGLDEMARWPLLVLAGYDHMQPEVQDKLVEHVRRGGHVLVTGLLPRWNDQLDRDRMPLREVLFPHGEEEFVRLRRPEVVQLAGQAEGRAAGWAVRVEPPPGAEPVARIHSDCVGYRVRFGAGTATYLGFSPWYAGVSNDDLALVEGNRGVAAWAARMAGVPSRWAWAEHPENVDVFMHHAPDDVQHLAVLARAAQPSEAEVVWTRADGRHDRCHGALVPRSGWLVTMAQGQPRSLLLKCVNDHEGLRAPPRLEVAGKRWGADVPCDLSVATLPGGEVRVSITIVEGGQAEVALGIPRELVLGIEGPDAPELREGADGGVRFQARERAAGGAYVLRLREGTHPWWRSPVVRGEAPLPRASIR